MSCREGTARHIDQVELLRADQVGRKRLRNAARMLGQHRRDIADRDRLHQQRRDRRDTVITASAPGNASSKPSPDTTSTPVDRTTGPGS